MEARETVAAPGAWWRFLPVLVLLLLAPAFAEYLAGYADSTGDPWALVAGLLFFVPLYGCSALLIREVARRTGRGWPTMLLLGIAFGITQAGLVDHSLFSTRYLGIEYWQSMIEPTYIPALGISAYTALLFVAGHALWSVSVPIALTEELFPERRTTPWLGNVGLAIAALFYVAMSALILVEHVRQEAFLPSPPQLLGTAVMVALLVAAGFRVGTPPARPGRAPSPWLVGAISLVLLSAPLLVEIIASAGGAGSDVVNSWPGVALHALMLLALAALAWRWSGMEGWTGRHIVALAAGVFFSRALLAFLVEPIGDVPLAAKLAHNVGFAILGIVLVALALRRQPASG